MEKGRNQSSKHLWSNFDSSFPLEDGQNRKNKQQCRKFSATDLSKYVKMKSLSSLHFLGKIRFFPIFGIYLPWNRAGSQVKGVELKFDKYSFIQTIPGLLPVKNFYFKCFPVLRLQITKDISEKILTWIFKFGWLSFYHSYIFKKLKLNYLLLNLMLTRLPQISNPRNEKPKSLYVLF